MAERYSLLGFVWSCISNRIALYRVNGDQPSLAFFSGKTDIMHVLETR